MAWIEQSNLRTPAAKTWRDTDHPTHHVRHHVLGTILHYPTVLDSEILDGEVDFTFQHVTAGGRDLYRTTVAGWHYALGKDIEGVFANVDGVVGFGGRQGARWLKSRLAKVGYLHWPTRAWQDVGGAPTYDRANLSREVDTLTIGPQDVQTTLNVGSLATWANIWNTPGGGALDALWRIDDRHLKEVIAVNQPAREWIAANRPPATPPNETWLSFVFRLDVSDIPRWVKAGILQDINGDFDDDDGKIEIRDALDRLLGFMPVSYAFSEPYQIGTSGEGEPIFAQDKIRLRKRIWRDGDGNHYLLIGARVDHLNQMHQGGVTFDPTWDTSVEGWGDKDTYISYDSQAENFGNATTFVLDGSAPAPTTVGLIEFDISGIPATATCDSATMYLYRGATGGSTAQTITLHEFLTANNGWGEGNGGDPGGVGESTWDYRDHGNTTAWAGSEGARTSGTDYVAAAIGSFATGQYVGVGDEYDFALTAGDVEDWFGASNENYGMVFWNTGVWIRDFCSSDHATSAYHPKLIVEYTSVARRVFVTHT